MSKNKTDDSAQSNDLFKLTILCVSLVDNMVDEAYLVRPEKIIKEIGKNFFELVCLIKESTEINTKSIK